jgi:hypothetical protein
VFSSSQPFRYPQQRLCRDGDQPTNQRNQVSKLPAPLWAKLQGFYEANKAQAVEDRLAPEEVGR